MALTRLNTNAYGSTINLASNVTGTLAAANGGTGLTSYTPGKILQVVSGTYSTEVSSTNSSAWTDTGLSLAITPSSTSSKIFFIFSQQAFVTRASSLARGLFRVLNTETGAAVYDSANHTINMQQSGSDLSHSTMLIFSGVHSPSATSARTYKTQMLPEASTTIKAQQNNHMSSVQLMEIGA